MPYKVFRMHQQLGIEGVAQQGHRLIFPFLRTILKFFSQSENFGMMKILALLIASSQLLTWFDSYNLDVKEIMLDCTLKFMIIMA